MINSILSQFNLKLSRSFKGSKPIPDINPSQNILIELIGPPASGKTTLLNLITEKHKFTHLSKHFYSSRKTYVLPTKLGVDYETLLKMKFIEVANRNIESNKKVGVFNALLEMAQADYFYKKIEAKYTIITDEGLLHNVSDVIIETASQLSTSFFEDRMVIYCRPNIDFIINNVIERRKNDETIPYHRGLTIEQIKDLTVKSFDNKDKLIEILKCHKVPILVVNTESEINQCLNDIDNWIGVNLK